MSPRGSSPRGPSWRSSRGFTLVEVLVVIAVIAILLGLLLPAVSRGVASARSVRCQTSLRTIAFDFTVFADPQLHPRRGEDETRTPGRFRLETFVDSQYGVDEFWEHGELSEASRVATSGSDDPMRCAEVSGELRMRKGIPCSVGALTPAENVSYAFNFRLQRADPPGERTRQVLLDSRVLQAGRVPLVMDVDAVLAARQSVNNNPSFMAPPLESGGPYGSGKLWWPGLRHAGAMNIGFVDGSVASTKEPLSEQGVRWNYRPR